MSYFDDSFSRHKSLTTLRLKNCKISDFTSLIPLLTQNQSIKHLDITGNKLNSISLIHIWAGLKLNITLHDVKYTTFGAFYDLQVI